MSKTETVSRKLAVIKASPFKTLAGVRARNAAEGFNFFSRDTMRFWKSRVESTLIRGRFFITSKDTWGFGGSPVRRIYTVRYANDSGTITSVRTFLRDKEDARELIARYVAGEHVKNRESGQRCIVCGEYGSECGGTA